MEIIVLPKGTLLFRGIHARSNLVSDYAGILSGKHTYCLSENYNVFFYPYPFIADAVSAMVYTEVIMYVTQRDLKLINLASPSKFSRSDRELNIGGITSCDALPEKCGVKGFDYDPCVDYSKVPLDVSGMIAIAHQDASRLEEIKHSYHPYFNKYFTTFKDARGVVGVPEIILHPRLDKKERTENIPNINKWYDANKKDLNYVFLHKVTNDRTSLEDLMMALTSSSGLVIDGRTYHVKLNKETNFFQVIEMSNTFPIAESGLSVKYPQSKLTRKNIFKTETSVGPVREEKSLDPRMLGIYYTPERLMNGQDNYVEVDILSKYMSVFSKFFNIKNVANNTVITYNGTAYIVAYTGNKASDEEYKPTVQSTFGWIIGHDVEAENKEKEARFMKRIKNSFVLKRMGENTPDYKMTGFVNTIYRKYLAKRSRGGTRRNRVTM